MVAPFVVAGQGTDWMDESLVVLRLPHAEIAEIANQSTTQIVRPRHGDEIRSITPGPNIYAYARDTYRTDILRLREERTLHQAMRIRRRLSA